MNTIAQQPDISRFHFISNCRRSVLLIALLLLPYLICQREARAEPVLSAFFNSMGSFSIVANNLNRMTEAEITINYQSDDPTPPVISSPFLDSKKTAPFTSGTLVIPIKSKKQPISGYVTLAVVQIHGTISSLNALLRFENGTTDVPKVSITNPTPEQMSEIAAQQNKVQQDQEATKSATSDSPTTTGSAGTTSPAKSDTVTQPAPQTEQTVQPRTADPSATRTSLQPPDQTTTPQPAPKTDNSLGERSGNDEDLPHAFSFTRHESLLERFRVSSGPHTSTSLATLLKSNDAIFVQRPPLVLTDGMSRVKLTIRTAEKNSKSLQFFINGGTCSNLKTAEYGAWILEITPERGSMNTSITVLSGSKAIEYPLAVSPPLELFDSTTASTEEIIYVKAANDLVHSKELQLK